MPLTLGNRLNGLENCVLGKKKKKKKKKRKKKLLAVLVNLRCSKNSAPEVPDTRGRRSHQATQRVRAGQRGAEGTGADVFFLLTSVN